jgi:hypothetical protein
MISHTRRTLIAMLLFASVLIACTWVASESGRFGIAVPVGSNNFRLDAYHGKLVVSRMWVSGIRDSHVSWEAPQPYPDGSFYTMSTGIRWPNGTIVPGPRILWVPGKDCCVSVSTLVLNTRTSAFSLAWLFAAEVVSLASLYWLIHRKQRLLQRGCCTVCGYDLRASVDRCPECGEAILATQCAK